VDRSGKFTSEGKWLRKKKARSHGKWLVVRGPLSARKTSSYNFSLEGGGDRTLVGKGGEGVGMALFSSLKSRCGL